MSGKPTPYIDGDLLHDAMDAVRAGQTVDSVASRLQIDPERLAQLIPKPILHPVPGIDPDDGYLWRADELDGLL